MYTLHFDGLFQSITGNQGSTSRAGFMGFGWLISRNGVLLASGHGVFASNKDATSLIAEYLALIEGLEAMCELGNYDEPLSINGDAKCIIEQMQGVACVNSPSMKPLHKRALRMAKKFKNIEWNWKPRRENQAADLLTRRAIWHIRSSASSYWAAVKAIDPKKKGKHQPGKYLPLVDMRIYNPIKLSYR